MSISVTSTSLAAAHHLQFVKNKKPLKHPRDSNPNKGLITTIGSTPLIRINSFSDVIRCEVKLIFFNPISPPLSSPSITISGLYLVHFGCSSLDYTHIWMFKFQDSRGARGRVTEEAMWKHKEVRESEELLSADWSVSTLLSSILAFFDAPLLDLCLSVSV